MGFFARILMAMALATDAFAVAVARGMNAGRHRRLDGLLTALGFGIAQAIMPILGFFGGHWLAYDFIHAGGAVLSAFILALLGVKMAGDALGEELPRSRYGRGRIGYLRRIFTQAVATSIDALVVGVGMCGVGEHIAGTSAMIGMVTFLACAGGFMMGARLRDIDCRLVQVIGGVLLMVLAARTLFG